MFPQSSVDSICSRGSNQGLWRLYVSSFLIEEQIVTPPPPLLRVNKNLMKLGLVYYLNIFFRIDVFLL